MTPPGVCIREATTADAESIAGVHVASIRALGREAYDDRQVRAWQATVDPERYPLEESGFRSIVAERDDAGIVGFGLLDRDPDDRDGSTGEISAIYVHPGHARTGVGRAILSTLEAAARDAGLETLVLTASKNAVGFYERHGYDRVETVSLELDEGVTLECLRMRTSIDATGER